MNLNPNPKDEATVFVLAGCMLKTYAAIKFKDSKTLDAIVKAVENIFNEDPHFVDRFKTAEAVAIKRHNRARLKEW